MKSRSDIEKRLRSLRVKYAKRYVSASQERTHRNCVHNVEHAPRDMHEDSKPSRSPLRRGPQGRDAAPPRRTLTVVRSEAPVRLCMYGCKDPASWAGDVCDSDDISRSCPKFEPLRSMEAARAEFLEKLADDEWVFDNHKDMAALQWALSDRMHKWGLSWWERLFLWLQVLLFRRAKVAPRLPLPELPEDLWKDDASPPPPAP